MNYIIVNNFNVEEFYRKTQEWFAKGVLFTQDYVATVGDAPGGWFGLKFTTPLPERTLFDLPDIEYRYSSDLDAWTVDGAVTPYSETVASLYNYFVSRNGA